MIFFLLEKCNLSYTLKIKLEMNLKVYISFLYITKDNIFNIIKKIYIYIKKNK